MTKKNSATKWVATGASMALAGGLGLAGLSLVDNSASAEAGQITTVATTVAYSPEKVSGEQGYHYDYDGNVTRIDLDLLNIHLRDAEWNFLNNRDAQNGMTATAHGRKFIYTDQETLYKVDEIVRFGKHHNPGFWAPVGPDGKIDHRYGAWGVAGKSTGEIGVGRLIYWDGTKWVNQSHFRVDWMDAPSGIHGYKVEGFREPSRSFEATVDGNYQGEWPSLADSKQRQTLVSAMAYMFANRDKYPEVQGCMTNAERRGDAILQLAMGSDLASSAEKALVYKTKYAAAIDKAFAMLDDEYVTPGDALEGKFTATETKNADGKTTFHLQLSKLGNKYFPINDGTATVTFEGEAAEAPAAAEKTEEKVEATTEAPAPVEKDEEKVEATEVQPTASTPAETEGDEAEDAGARSAAADEAAPLTYSLKELNEGVDIVVPNGQKAVVSFESDEVAAPGSFLNRTSLTGTSMVVESGVNAKVTGTIELGTNAVNAAPVTGDENVEPEGPAGDLPEDTATDPEETTTDDAATQTDEDKTEAPATEEPAEKVEPAVEKTVKPADPVKTATAAPAAQAPVTAQASAPTSSKAPLAKTGASSMFVLLMAAGLATAGTGVVMARRNA